MPQADDGRGNLYEQVLEYAKHEMDEAASKMEDIKQSLQLLDARVEAAKAVYQAVASRLNLEDEADGASFQASFPETPVQAPEPPLSAEPEAPAERQIAKELVAPAAPPELVVTNGPPPASDLVQAEPGLSATPAGPDESDLDIIRQQKTDREAPEPSAPQVEPVAPDNAAPTSQLTAESSSDDDSFSTQLIRQHLEQKAQQQDAPPSEPTMPAAVAPATSEVAPAGEENAGGFSDADRELIGSYLKSKQN